MANEFHTPHINAAPEDFAPTVLMPGDPKRSRFIAESFLDGARLINDVRGIQGYTGTYLGKPITVMASGMGIPSIGIYSYELFKFFGVENIIRVGTAGGFSPDIKLRDIIIAQGACTTSDFAAQYNLGGSFAPIADYTLLSAAVESAKELGARYAVGNVLSSDVFYNADPDFNLRWQKMGVLGVEMEAAGLYMNAAALGKRALAICGVSDHVFTGEALDAQARQTSLSNLIQIALNTAARL